MCKELQLLFIFRQRWLQFYSNISGLWVSGIKSKCYWAFFQTVWIVAAMAVVGPLPDSRIKRWLHKRAYLITFRILARSLSAIINEHNKEYRPSSGGVCVSNHTSPIDIVMVSTESCFSLVSDGDWSLFYLYICLDVCRLIHVVCRLRSCLTMFCSTKE